MALFTDFNSGPILIFLSVLTPCNIIFAFLEYFTPKSPINNLPPCMISMIFAFRVKSSTLLSNRNVP